MSIAEIASLGGKIWRQFSDPERQSYRDRYASSRAVYDVEIKEFIANGGIVGVQADPSETPKVNRIPTNNYHDLDSGI